jgi:hypothetical protein
LAISAPPTPGPLNRKELDQSKFNCYVTDYTDWLAEQLFVEYGPIDDSANQHDGNYQWYCQKLQSEIDKRGQQIHSFMCMPDTKKNIIIASGWRA